MSTIRMTVIIAALCAPSTSIAVDANASGARPGDDAMTCQQIAAELAPYMGQMRAPVEALNQTNQEIVARSEKRVAEETPAAAAMSAAATAAMLDPTGASSRAVGQAEMAHQQEVWNRSVAEDKPLADRQAAQTKTVVAAGQQLQVNARLMRLMDLVQQKNCDKQ